MGKTVSAANKEQASGRVNGNHGDFDRKGNQLICTHYDTLVGKEKLIKGVNLHRQMIKDICTMKFEANDGRVIDHSRGYKMFSNRVPTNYYGNTVGANDTIKKIPNPNSILEEESFTRHKRVISTLQMINPEQYGEKRRKRNIERKEAENLEQNEYGSPDIDEIRKYGKEEYNNILNKFTKWVKTSNNVSKFIKSLKLTKIYTKIEFNQLCKDTGAQGTHLQRLNYTSSKGYGRIIEKIDNCYRLYPVLVYGLGKALDC
jgi:lysophospholipase L1-like esterase